MIVKTYFGWKDSYGHHIRWTRGDCCRHLCSEFGLDWLSEPVWRWAVSGDEALPLARALLANLLADNEQVEILCGFVAEHVIANLSARAWVVTEEELRRWIAGAATALRISPARLSYREPMGE